MKIYARVLSLLLGLIGIACSPLVFSQAPLQAPTEQSASSYSDSELKSFAVAALEVKRISDTYLPKFESATSPEEQQQIRQTASQEMVRAVEREGISLEKYKEIVNQAQANPAIADRIREQLRSVDK